MSTFERKMKILGGILNLFRRSSRISTDCVDFTQTKNIVVINNKRLGDFLFCTPAIRALKDANSVVKIIAVISKNNKGLISECPYIDDVIYMDNNIFSSIKTGYLLRKYSPELGVIFHSKNPYGFIVLTCAGVCCLLKHYFSNEKKVLLNSCDAYVIGGSIPPVRNNLELVGKLGINIAGKDMFYPSPVGPKSGGGTSVGIQLGASSADRYFPTDTAAIVVEEIARKNPECIFHLLGSPLERYLATDFFRHLGEEFKHNVVDHIGKTSLQELAEIINNLAVLITPDTGCLHIATALRTKTVGLFLVKQPNTSIPQQDAELHQVLYAAEYPGGTPETIGKSKLSTIPAGNIIKMVTQALS